MKLSDAENFFFFFRSFLCFFNWIFEFYLQSDLNESGEASTRESQDKLR